MSHRDGQETETIAETSPPGYSRVMKEQNIHWEIMSNTGWPLNMVMQAG